MSIFFYTLSLKFYQLAIFISSFFSKKAKQWIVGRQNIFERIEKSGVNQSKNIWFHVASLGEFEQGLPVMEKIRNQFPEHKIVLTFFSPSGYEVRKKTKAADFVFYLPMDSPKNAQKFIKLIKPEKAFFVKYEFWYFYLKNLSENKIPTYLFSAIFREKQHFFKWYGSLGRKMLSFFEHIFVQNQKSVELLAKIGIENVSIAGDTRFDRVAEIAQNSKKFEIVEQFSNTKFCFVAGSTWEADEKIIIDFINTKPENLKFIIAPHNISEKNILRITNLLQVDYSLYSNAKLEPVSQKQVLIIDNIGMLSSLYKYGQIAYIGGGFGTGIHNTLEAAVFGMPVIFGTNYQRFQEAVDLINKGAGLSISNFEEFENLLNLLLQDENLLKKKSEIAENYVKSKCGATDIILKF